MSHRFPVSDLLSDTDKVNDTVSFEVPTESDDDLTYIEPVSGQIVWQPVSESEILAHVTGAARVELICDRCLVPYESALELDYYQAFHISPDSPDHMAIERDLTIDITPSIRQEIQVQLPMKLICRADCPGLEFTS